MPAPPRPKRRWRVLALALAACAVLLIAAAVASVRWSAWYAYSTAGGVQRMLAVSSAMAGAAGSVSPIFSTEGFAVVSNRKPYAGWWPRWTGDTAARWSLYVPLWIPAAGCAAAAVACWRIDRAQRRRLAQRLCLACGYDRAGLPEAATAPCPECGVPPPP